jgi:hypothetical protein
VDGGDVEGVVVVRDGLEGEGVEHYFLAEAKACS